MRTSFILILFLSFLFGNCGIYSFYGTDDSGATTFSVEMFDIKAPKASPLLGQTFSEKLRNLVQQQSTVQLIEAKGELQFSGSITKYDTQPISVQGDETASQSRLTIGIDVIYVNTIEEKKSFEKSFNWYTDYASDADFLSVEEGLIELITDQLAQDVYNASLGNW